MIVLAVTEECAIVSSFVWTRHRERDGRTDGRTRRTDRHPLLLQRSALRAQF